jgi:NAD(P)-dependent dehydrogenase (short-subunit alcohol dehydrogenase family)
MLTIPLADRVVVVTGGTRGLGKAIGLEFARAGATVYLTHRWGSVDETALMSDFQMARAALPHVVQSDVSDPEATRELMRTIAQRQQHVDVIVSNVAFAKVVRDLQDLKRNALELSLRYSAWPIVDLLQAAHEVLGKFPRYALGISSDGTEVCHPGYELAGASKAVLETLCRYLAIRLRNDGVRVNAVRPGFLDTASSRATFGEASLQAAQGRIGDRFLDPHKVALVCVALCSGLMDAVTGQVLTVDEGASLLSPLALMER